MNRNFTNWADEIDWEAVGIKVTAHVESKKGRRRWGGSEGRLPGGYLPQDVTQDVITRYLEIHYNDPEHSITEQELVIRLRKSAVSKLKALSGRHANVLGVTGLDDLDEIFLIELDNTFDQDAFELQVLSILENESILLSLYEDLHDKGLTKEEIKQKQQIEEQEYKNRVRRLRRRIEPLLKQHNITRQHGRGSKKNDTPAERA